MKMTDQLIAQSLEDMNKAVKKMVIPRTDFSFHRYCRYNRTISEAIAAAGTRDVSKIDQAMQAIKDVMDGFDRKQHPVPGENDKAVLAAARYLWRVKEQILFPDGR